MSSPRFQDLSREQAFGLEARILQRLARLLIAKNEASTADVEDFFSGVLELSYTLGELALGSLSIAGARPIGEKFHDRLGNAALFTEESAPAADAVACVTDALGDLGLIRYSWVPGLSEYDKRNPDVVRLLSAGSWTLSKLGMAGEVFQEPAKIDCALIFKIRADGFEYLTPEFFSRPLWPTERDLNSNDGMPFALDHVLFRDWKESLRSRGLSGVAASYDACLNGVFLTQKTNLRGEDRRPQQYALATKNETEENYALVMKGGGLKGLACVGALRELQRFYNFDLYVGTSAGAIIAALLGAGYTADEMERILRDMNFADFLSERLKTITNLFFHGGLFRGTELSDWVDRLLAEKLNSPTRVKFRQLRYQARIYACRRDTDALIFDSEQSPNMSVAHAVRCSVAIPLFFTPERDQGLNVFDGGMRHNYPVKKLLEQTPDKKFVGLYLGDPIYTPTKRSILRDLISISTEATDIEALERYRSETIVIDPKPVSTLDFSLSAEEKTFLLSRGRAAAIGFLYSKGHVRQSDVEDAIEIARKDKIAAVAARSKRTFRRKLVSILIFASITASYLIWKFGTADAFPLVIGRLGDTYEAACKAITICARSAKLTVIRRDGHVSVQLRGTGGGELSQNKTAEETLGGKSDARVEASGAERSDCNVDSGRTRSEGRVVASMKPFELTGLKMQFDLWLQGGHYRTAATCVGKNQPVGLVDIDTDASAFAKGTGEIAFQAAAPPFDLRIVWQDMPAESGFELIGPDGSVHSSVAINGAAERIVKMTAAGNWWLKIVARVEAKATGGSGQAHVTHQPLIFLEAR